VEGIRDSAGVPLIPINGSYFARFGNSKLSCSRPPTKKHFVHRNAGSSRCSKIVLEDLKDLHCKDRSTWVAEIAVRFKFTPVPGGIVTATAAQFK
jgi:hypothetical protein